MMIFIFFANNFWMILNSPIHLIFKIMIPWTTRYNILSEASLLSNPNNEGMYFYCICNYSFLQKIVYNFVSICSIVFAFLWGGKATLCHITTYLLLWQGGGEFFFLKEKAFVKPWTRLCFKYFVKVTDTIYSF